MWRFNRRTVKSPRLSIVDERRLDGWMERGVRQSSRLDIATFSDSSLGDSGDSGGAFAE